MTGEKLSAAHSPEFLDERVTSLRAIALVCATGTFSTPVFQKRQPGNDVQIQP
jgi:hypothetical protein